MTLFITVKCLFCKVKEHIFKFEIIILHTWLFSCFFYLDLPSQNKTPYMRKHIVKMNLETWFYGQSRCPQISGSLRQSPCIYSTCQSILRWGTGSQTMWTSSNPGWVDDWVWEPLPSLRQGKHYMRTTPLTNFCYIISKWKPKLRISLGSVLVQAVPFHHFVCYWVLTDKLMQVKTWLPWY